jgi:hypothetical protein
LYYTARLPPQADAATKKRVLKHLIFYNKPFDDPCTAYPISKRPYNHNQYVPPEEMKGCSNNEKKFHRKHAH